MAARVLRLKTGDAALASKYTLKLEDMQRGLATDGVVTFAALNEAGDILASVNVGKKGDAGDTGQIGNLTLQDAYQRGGVGGRVLAYSGGPVLYRNDQEC
ncbi:hypothetical protein MY4824_005912 [Beauveria thailandica]